MEHWPASRGRHGCDLGLTRLLRAAQRLEHAPLHTWPPPWAHLLPLGALFWVLAFPWNLREPTTAVFSFFKLTSILLVKLKNMGRTVTYACENHTAEITGPGCRPLQVLLSGAQVLLGTGTRCS